MYSENRLINWIKKIENAKDEESLEIFDQMMEDVVIACLNIVRAIKEREIKKDDAEKELKKIRDLFSREIRFDSEVKDLAFKFTAESVEAIVRSFQYYLEGKTSKKSFESLLNEAFRMEKAGDLDGALDLIAKIGAKVISGEKLPDIDVESDSIILSWLDGIDCISTVLELSRIDTSNE
ncbi:MAG: DUF2150 family protein [Archaeoglobaceae archaeon]|nr:DUF2150 family protein [Archaeoglobaceae archaeon]MCX8152171.1 DUF2150 family protein [Archaeoglobaceae archaeon]MDW8013887.1 DUF2150 family protein [Archaeoglobaceae archaeon]